VHHYAHHIGDYRPHTAHLTMVEDGAYRRLLDLYYLHEKPLPGDVATCQRLTACRSKEERAAVETILSEFFSLEADGWHQRKADAIIAEYQGKAETARKNGRGGGRPKTKEKPSENQSGFSSVPKTNPDETVTVNRKPLTNSDANASGADAPKIDPVKVLFDEGVRLLTDTGTPEPQARSLIGRWRKNHGDEATRTAIQAAYDHGAVAPVEFIAASLTRAPKAHETWDQRRIREAMEAIQ